MSDERALIFRRFPLIVAAATELAAPGDFVTDEVSGVPLLLTRTDDGLKAFVNVCRHRATILEHESGGREKHGFVCPLHGWSYGADGKLAGVPPDAGFSFLDRSKLDLMPVPVAEAFGLVWVSLNRSLPLEPRAFTAGIAEDLDALALGERLVEKHQHRSEANVSWREMIPMFFDSDGGPVEERGLHFRFTSSVADRAMLYVFPNVIVSRIEETVRIIRISPIRPGVLHDVVWTLLRPGSLAVPFDTQTRRRCGPEAEAAFERAIASALEQGATT